MDCRGFHNRLDDFLRAGLRGDDLAAARAHVLACPECREVVEILEASSASAQGDPPPGLVHRILERTTGSTCGSAKDRLCDFVDGFLDPIEAELLRLHLCECGECAALGDVLARLGDELPGLAEVEPEEGFAEAVLARTLPWRRRLARRLPRLAELGARLASRPRIALEGAYAGTLVLVLILGPSALADAPAWAARLVAPAEQLTQPSRARDRVASGLQVVWGATGGKAADIAAETRDELTARYERTRDARVDLRRHRDELLEATLEADPTRATQALKGIGSDLGTLSRRLASDNSEEERER
jgi:hypothetical protein